MSEVVEHNGLRLIHERWEASGRTYQVVDADDQPTGQKCYRATIGERNIDDGVGGLAPFLWQAATHRLQYGRNGMELEAATEEMKILKGASVLARSYKFVVQAEIGGEWVNMPKGQATRQIRPDEVFRDGEFVTDDRRCTVFWSWSPALYDLRVGIEAGGGEGASMGLRFRPAQNARVRFLIVLDGLEKLPADWEWLDRTIAEETRHVGIRGRDIQWRWTWDEAPYRSIIKEDNVDGTMKVAVVLGPYETVADEWLTVYPDTWGETAITDTADDCMENEDFYPGHSYRNFILCTYTNGMIVGSGWLSMAGFRFQNVTVAGEPSSVDAGTQIEYDVISATSGSFTMRVFGMEGDIAAWEDTDSADDHEPTDETWTTAYIDVTTPSASADNLVNGADFQAVVKEILDTSWSSGYDMGFVFHRNGEASDYIEMTDVSNLDGGSAARLTIVYTAGGGGAVEAVAEDAVDVADEVVVELVNYEIVVEDAVTLTDEVTANLGGYVEAVAEDAVTLTDEVTARLGGYVEAVAEDAVTVTDVVVASLGGYVEAVAEDVVTLTDEVSVQVPVLEAVAEDAVTVTDVVVASLGGYVEAVAEDAVTVSDEVTASLGGYVEAVAEDAVTVTDEVTARLGGYVEAVAEDAVTVSDEVVAELTSYNIIVSDNLTLSDTPTAEIPTYEIAIDDTVDIAESVVPQVLSGLIVTSYDSLSVTDEVNININPLQIETSDSLSLGDIVIASVSGVDIIATYFFTLKKHH